MTEKKKLYAELILCDAPENGRSKLNQLGLIRNDDGQVIGFKIGDGTTDWSNLKSVYYTKDDIDTFLCQTTTHQELLTLRNHKQLKPGQYYRITDYQCEVNEIFADTISSTDNKFDIIIQALSNATLSENAYADCHYEDGVPDGYFSENIGNIYLKSVAYIAEDEYGEEDIGSSQHIDDVFIVCGYTEEESDYVDVGTPYLLKTDVCAFPYEVDEVDIFYYAGPYELDGTTYDKWRKIDDESGWNGPEKRYALTESIVDDSNNFKAHIYTTYRPYMRAQLSTWEIKYCLDNAINRFEWASPSGKGVIYYMKDEWGNECPYDFKNILFEGNYTFQKYQAELDDASIKGAAKNCIIGSMFNDQSAMVLPRNVITIDGNCSNIIIEKNNYNVSLQINSAHNITVKSGLSNEGIIIPPDASNVVYKPANYSELIPNE